MGTWALGAVVGRGGGGGYESVISSNYGHLADPVVAVCLAPGLVVRQV